MGMVGISGQALSRDMVKGQDVVLIIVLGWSLHEQSHRKLVGSSKIFRLKGKVPPLAGMAG